MINVPKETAAGPGKFIAESDVYLEGGHICIKKSIVDMIFGAEPVILCIYYEKDQTFFAAPSDEELFRKLHKGSQFILKIKNALGDRSISVQELLLDQDVSNADRNLKFTAETSLRILKIKL